MSDHGDVIALRGLSAVGSHGVYDFERDGAQVFSADLKLYVDSRQAALTDDVAYTVDYSQLAEKAVEILSGTPVYLLETLASKLAEMALTFPLVHTVEVTVHKPMAPVRHQFEDVSVTVTRSRGEKIATRVSRFASQQNPQDSSEPPVQIADSEKPAPMPPRKSERKSPYPRRSAVKHAASVATAPPITGRSFANSQRPVDGTTLIPRSFDDGSPTYRAVLSLGSNKGDSVRTLAGAVAALRDTSGFEVLEVGPLVRTLPVLEPGALPQPDYMNTVVIGRTVLPPPVLLRALNRIEAEFGRVRSRRWAARTLDIDIIDLDRMTINNRDLVLPHPRAHQRSFVLYPWVAIAPDDRLPGHGNISELLKGAPDLSGLLSVREGWLGENDQVVSGSERQLHERPKKEQLTAKPDLPSVTVRGEQLHLAPIERDPIFKKLLEKESPSATTDGTKARMRPAQQTVERPRISTQRRTVSEPSTKTPMQGTPIRSQSLRHGSLPDWRAATGGRVPKVVDESGYGTDAAAATTTGSIAAGRRVTVRPTPTGTIPVVRRTGKP